MWEIRNRWRIRRLSLPLFFGGSSIVIRAGNTLLEYVPPPPSIFSRGDEGARAVRARVGFSDFLPSCLASAISHYVICIWVAVPLRHPRHREFLLRRRICVRFERFCRRLLTRATARRRDDMVDRCWTEQPLIWRCGMKEMYNATPRSEFAIIRLFPESAIGNSKPSAIGKWKGPKAQVTSPLLENTKRCYAFMKLIK